MEFKNAIISDELAATLFNTRFVKDTSRHSHTSTGIALSSSWNITEKIPISSSSLTSTTLPMVSFSRFDRNSITIESLLINELQENDYDEDELPLYKHIKLNKENSILYLPENMMKSINYSDWEKILELMNNLADPNLVTTYETWHGMKMVGIHMYIRYLMTLVESKPDIILIVEDVKTCNNMIETKISWTFTDCYDIHQQLYKSNYTRDVLTSNTTCARTLRLLPIISLNLKSSVEIREILDLLESNEDLFVTGVSYMQFIVESSTHKLIKLHLDPRILSLKVKPKVS